MRLHAFELKEPLPELNNAHALAVIMPWIDASKAGSMVLSCMENFLGTRELARLARPGYFFDLTRYRPKLIVKENGREVEIPNAVVNYSKDPDRNDFVFLRLLEPHMLAEVYVDSVVEILKALNIKRYCFIGSMYDMVPYTRPLLVTGNASNLALQNAFATSNVTASDYHGPTTILSLVEQKILEAGIETCSMIVHLPNYLVMEDDYRGVKRLMDILSSFYNIPMPQADIEKANHQEQQVKQLAEQFMEQEPQYKTLLKQLEDSYDSRINKEKPEVKLSPEIERFLKSLNIRFKQD